MGRNYRTYRDGCTHHVYCKAVDGNIIFYSSRDCIYYITLYYHLARRYGIVTRAFGIMPNHVHSNEEAPTEESFFSFQRDLTRVFTKEYNSEHKRTGRLFIKPFGFAPKIVGKRVRDNIAYIVNNPVVGKLSKTIDSYRWNLMAYRNTDHPFSNKILLNKASYRLRRSLGRLQYYFDNGIPLNYACQRMLFDGLTSKEVAQLTDRIIYMHNFLDYGAMADYYQGSIENAVTAISANSGSEHDIPEDFDDYSVYKKMSQLAMKNGVDLKECNFETWTVDELAQLADKFSWAGFSSKQIRIFLHLKQERFSVRGAQLIDNQRKESFNGS